MALAIFLFLFGIFSLVAAWLHFTQRILGKHQAVSCMPGGVVWVQATGVHQVQGCNLGASFGLVGHAKRTADDTWLFGSQSVWCAYHCDRCGCGGARPDHDGAVAVARGKAT